MHYIDRVPCNDGQSNTGFGFILSETSENAILVDFVGFCNFCLADVKWRQKFTDNVAAQIEETHPGRPVLFGIN